MQFTRRTCSSQRLRVQVSEYATASVPYRGALPDNMPPSQPVTRVRLTSVYPFGNGPTLCQLKAFAPKDRGTNGAI